MSVPRGLCLLNVLLNPKSRMQGQGITEIASVAGPVSVGDDNE